MDESTKCKECLNFTTIPWTTEGTCSNLYPVIKVAGYPKKYEPSSIIIHCNHFLPKD